MADSRYYNQNRGPILRVVGSKMEMLLTCKEFFKLDSQGVPVEAQYEDFTEFHPEIEDLFVCDDVEQFSATRSNRIQLHFSFHWRYQHYCCSVQAGQGRDRKE